MSNQDYRRVFRKKGPAIPFDIKTVCAPYECIVNSIDEKEIKEIFLEKNINVKEVTAKKNGTHSYVEFNTSDELKEALDLNGVINLTVVFNSFWVREKKANEEATVKIHKEKKGQVSVSQKSNPFYLLGDTPEK